MVNNVVNQNLIITFPNEEMIINMSLAHNQTIIIEMIIHSQDQSSITIRNILMVRNHLVIENHLMEKNHLMVKRNSTIRSHSITINTIKILQNDNDTVLFKFLTLFFLSNVISLFFILK